MNKRLFNQQNLTRRLRLLSVLFAMLLMPFSAWAEDYPLIVAGVQVTDANKGNVLQGETATVTFTPAGDAPATLTLNGATLGGSIVLQSGLDDLTIHLLGENKIQGADYQTPLANGIKRENGATTGTLTFTTSGASGTLFFPYVTTPIEGFSNIVYNNGLEWGCDSYYDSSVQRYCTNFYEGVGTNVVLASVSWRDCITKTQTTLSLTGGATITFREDNSLGRVLTLSGFTDYISSICWYSHSDVKFEINGTNSFIFENPMLVGNDQSNVSFIATGTSAATLRFWHKGTGANRLSLSVPFIDEFKNSANPGLGEGLYNVDVLESRIDPDNNFTTDYTEHYITTEAYDLKVSGVRVHNLDGVYTGHKDHILGEISENVYNTSVTFAPAGDAPATLTLNGADIFHTDEENAIISSLSTPLYVHLLGENTINSQSYLPFEGATGDDANLVFTTTTDAAPGSLTMASLHADFGKTTFYTGFNEVQYPENSGFLYATEDESGNVIITQNQSYGLKIAGEALTKDNVSADGTVTGIAAITAGTVKYTPANTTVSPATPATLTLTNATIIPETEEPGIAYMGETGLTISIKGTNTVKGVGGCPAIAYYNENQLETLPSLTFTKGDEQACSLLLEAQGGTAVIDNFADEISHDGLYMIEDFREENETLISTTTFTSALFGGGSGTAQDPFLLKTKEDVRDFAKYINNMSISSGASFQLYNDIDCDGLTGYEAAGNDNNPFSGVFDGNKKTISNLTAQDGLFHTIGGATIKDLTLSGCTITGTTGSNAAGIAVETTMSASAIQNCSVVNSTIACKADANNPTVGGILALSYGATVTGCTIDNVQVRAETTYASGNIAQGVAGGIVGNASGGEISSCEVKNGSKITDYNAKETATLKAGAIVGDYYGTTLSANYYYYNVNVETLNGTDTENKVTKSGYTQRAVGGTQEEENPDVTANNGAVMYTKALTVGISNEFESDYYEPFTNYENGIFAFAPGQTIDIDLFPADGVIISAASLVYTPTGGEEQTVALTNTAEDPGYYSYSFEMPDADATLNATIVESYALWIGETQVTSENADDVLGDDGSVTFTVSDGQDAAPTYTLTLNDAALTVPVKVGLSNLTIDIHGSNTITTNTTCIQNVAEKVTPSLTFKSTSDVVGSLILTKGGDGRISDIGEGYITVSNELAVSLTVYGTEDYTSRLYYITDGSTTVAKIVPGYGVTINEKQVHAGNAANVLGDDDNVTVSFDEETATLTLNNASGISTISTSLSTLNIDLIGSNSLYRSSDGSILESLSGEDATIYLESTSATGVLTIKAPTNYGATIIGEDVTLTPVAPVVLLSSDVENNKGTLMYGVSYGLTVDGVPVTIANAGDVKNDDGTVKFDGRNRLVLNNASLAGITVGTTNTLPESELEIYLGGNSTIANNDGYAVKSEGVAAAVKLKFLTRGDAPGTLTYTNGGEASENVFPGFNVSYSGNLAKTTEANVTTVRTPLQLIVDEVASTAQTTTTSISYSEPAPEDASVTTNALKNLIVRNVLYTLNDLGTAESLDGYDQTKKLLVINSTMTDAQVQQVHEKVMSGECHPSLPSMGGQPSFEDYFRGLTFMVPAGEGVIGINSETAEGFEFHLKIGGQPAIKVKKTNITYFIHYSVTENTFVYLYLVATGTSAPAYAQSNGGHRIGPKSSVSGALGGLSVQSNSVSTAPDASASYLMMSVHDFAPVVGSHGVKVNNADVTDMPDGAFAMSIGPAPRRAPDANMMTFIDASDTKITGKSFSRTEGAFKGVPEETLIYLPAGNTAVGKNFVIGGICEDLELKATRENPFEAAADFTAAVATFDREFTEGEVGTEKKCYTIFLPYALNIEEVDGELWEYTGYDSANETVTMNQVVATSDNQGWTTPNTVYFFKPSKNGALKPMLSTQVKKFTGTVAEPDNEAEADGMHGVYEYYKWTTKPSNVYCYSASDKDGIEAGEFAKVGVDTYINPFRAYLRLSTSSAPEFLSITWGDGTTSIVPLDKEQVRQDADGWYTITGFRLPSKPTEKGIYIHNNKKTIVK